MYVRSFTKPQLLHTPEGRLGVAKGCLETPGPPQSSTEPSPGTGTWHKLGALLAGAGINKGLKEAFLLGINFLLYQLDFSRKKEGGACLSALGH